MLKISICNKFLYISFTIKKRYIIGKFVIYYRLVFSNNMIKKSILKCGILCIMVGPKLII